MYDKFELRHLQMDEWADLDFSEIYTKGHTHDDLWQEAQLRSYIEFKDTTSPLTLMSVMAKLVCGILPLKIEVEDIKWTCRVYGLDAVEKEYHFIFDCPPLQGICSKCNVDAIRNLEQFRLLPDLAKVRFLIDGKSIKKSSAFICSLYRMRRQILYRVSIVSTRNTTV